jgi:nitrate reductase gamma subunit
LLGTLLGFLIPDLVRPKTIGENSFLPLQMAMIAVAISAMLLIIATTLKVKERLEFTRLMATAFGTVKICPPAGRF